MHAHVADKRIYTIEKNNEKISISSAHNVFSAVFWNIVNQLAAIFCPSGNILTFGDTNCVKGLISLLESPWHDVKEVAWTNQLIVFVL